VNAADDGSTANDPSIGGVVTTSASASGMQNPNSASTSWQCDPVPHTDPSLAEHGMRHVCRWQRIIPPQSESYSQSE
jgi:hypothetical protein